MKKPLSKILAVIMSLAMFASCFAVSAFASSASDLIDLLTNPVSFVVKTGVNTLTDANKIGSNVLTIVDKTATTALDTTSTNLNFGTAVKKNIAATLDGITSAEKGINNGLDLATQSVKLGTTINTGNLDTATAALKAGTNTANAAKDALDLGTSAVKLGSTANSGLKNGIADVLKTADYGVKIADNVNSIVDPVGRINTGLSLFNDSYQLYKNVEEIKANKDSENAPAETPTEQTAQEVPINEDVAA